VSRIQTVYKLQKFISTYACIISAPSTPTYFPSDMNRLLDIGTKYSSNQIDTIQLHTKINL